MASHTDSPMPTLRNIQDGEITSPARGAEMRNFLQSRLLQKNRAPPLVHSWEFWHDRQDRAAQQVQYAKEQDQQGDKSYEDRLVGLAPVNDVRSFWNVYNNFDITQLPLRDSVHLFHKGVKPIWEDPRNLKGGSWTFRVPKAVGPEFWKEICMMAIGEKLQEAVESERTTFRDDICGISLSVRFNSFLVQVWNRDSAHKAGIQRILDVVKTNVTDGLVPRDGSYYYKRHNEHAGFAASESQDTVGGSMMTGADTEMRQPNTDIAFSDSTVHDRDREDAVDAVQYMKDSNEQMKQSMDHLSRKLES